MGLFLCCLSQGVAMAVCPSRGPGASFLPLEPLVLLHLPGPCRGPTSILCCVLMWSALPSALHMAGHSSLAWARTAQCSVDGGAEWAWTKT